MHILFALILVVIPLTSWAFDFKGVIVGGLATPADIRERLGVDCGDGYEGMQVCNGYVTVAKEPASMNLVISPKGIVQRINLSISPDVFEEIASELIRKFGKPTSTDRSTVQNRMGAKYLQVIYLWRKKDGTQIIYSKYSGSLDESTLNFSTKEDRDMLRKQKDNRSSDI